MDIAQIGGLALALMGIALNIFFRKRSYNPVIQHSYRSCFIASQEMGDAGIRLMHANRQLYRLGVTTIRIWNKGRVPLRHGEDVKGRIVISFADNAKIIDANVIERTREDGNPANIGVRKLSETSIELKFTHLDHRDGALIDILHTSKHSHPVIRATIVGKKRPFKNAGEIKVAASWRRQDKMVEAAVRYILVPTAIITASSLHIETVLAAGAISIVGLLIAALVKTRHPKALSMRKPDEEGRKR